MKLVVLIGKITLLATVFCCVAVPLAASEDDLTVSGCSVSYVGYLRDVAQEYEKRAGKKVHVRGGGTVGGLENLKEGKVDFAATCRNKLPGDPNDVRFVQVAWDALVFVVHPSNPVKNLSIEEIRSIYIGKTHNWKQLRGSNLAIKVFVSKSTKGLQGIESSIRELVLRGKSFDDNPDVLPLPSGGIVEQTIEKTPEGFGATGFTSARTRSLRMLSVDGVPPTKKNIMTGAYPLKRPLYLVLPRNPKPEAKKFLDFVLSSAGQRFISSLGAVSLKDMK